MLGAVTDDRTRSLIPSPVSTKKDQADAGLFSWLGRRDSNPRMPVPKTGALPLGDAL